MAKRTWNPCSAVNQNHVTGMLAKGHTDYVNFCARIFAAKAIGDAVEFMDCVHDGLDAGYLSDDNAEKLLGRTNSAAVAEAAAGNAQATMISGLANAGMNPAIAQLISNGTVTAPQVEQVYSALGKELPPSIVAAIAGLDSDDS